MEDEVFGSSLLLPTAAELSFWRAVLERKPQGSCDATRQRRVSIELFMFLCPSKLRAIESNKIFCFYQL